MRRGTDLVRPESAHKPKNFPPAGAALVYQLDFAADGSGINCLTLKLKLALTQKVGLVTDPVVYVKLTGRG